MESSVEQIRSPDELTAFVGPFDISICAALLQVGILDGIDPDALKIHEPGVCDSLPFIGGGACVIHFEVPCGDIGVEGKDAAFVQSVLDCDWVPQLLVTPAAIPEGQLEARLKEPFCRSIPSRVINDFRYAIPPAKFDNEILLGDGRLTRPPLRMARASLSRQIWEPRLAPVR